MNNHLLVTGIENNKNIYLSDGIFFPHPGVDLPPDNDDLVWLDRCLEMLFGIERDRSFAEKLKNFSQDFGLAHSAELRVFEDADFDHILKEKF